MSRACVDLLFEVENVRDLVLSLDVTLGVTGARDVEAALLGDVSAKLGGVAEVVLRLNAVDEIAAQREDVFDTVFAEVLESCVDVSP